MVAHLSDGHPEAERSGVEGSPVAKKKSSKRDWVLGPGDPSIPLRSSRDDPPVGAAAYLLLSIGV
ncbi:hypothetical protein [Ravibacter arvi]|uniref:hypothetical protein n=1 Tax=Ravibacter arvi TaxID=2051041 RepID=UPI0031E9F034